MPRKILAITYLYLYNVFTDVNLLILMLVTPLAIATIIALALGGVVDGGGIRNIPVALVNLDTGNDEGTLNGGQIFVNALVEPADYTEEDADGVTLYDLTDTTLVTDAAEAREGVDNGDYVAAIIIPANFSESIDYSEGDAAFQPVTVEVYGNQGNSILANIVRSIVESISNQLMASQISIASTVNAILDRDGPAFFQDNPSPDFSPAFAPPQEVINIVQQNPEGKTNTVNLLVIFGAGQAAFFALFTSNGGATNILEQKRNGTLQRLIISPTPRSAILLAILIGVFLNVLIQLTFLFAAFSAVNLVLNGEFLIWGTHYAAIIGLILATSLAASGVGMVTAAVARSVEQAQIIGSVVALIMGSVGGAFFQLPDLPIVNAAEKISIVSWAAEGFRTLAEGKSDIVLNMVVLALLGGILFITSLLIFSRRADI